MICKNCGANLPDGTTFCPSCGQNLQSSAPVMVKKSNDKLKKIGIVTAIIAFIPGLLFPGGSLIFLIGAIPLIIYVVQSNKSAKQQEFMIQTITASNGQLQTEITYLRNRFHDLGFQTYDETVAAIAKAKSEAESELKSINDKIEVSKSIQNDMTRKNNELSQQSEKLTKQVESLERKLLKEKELYSAVTYAVDSYFEYDPSLDKCKIPTYMAELYDELAPTVTLRIHSMDVKTLNKAFRDNDKQITDLLSQYQVRYSTKANKALYSLMVIGLRSELQNILTNLKFDKLDNAIEQIRTVTAKYIAIAEEGNQNIASTLTKFIGAAEYLFINAAKIEYDYYVKKEQARQEQIAIREQMRQEAQERKELEAQKKKIEEEESKYHSEIEKVKQQMLEASEAEKAAYEAKILELKSQLSDITVKKDTIINLQNGKAGNIYIISNLGSFGENVFKVGMTRRLNPQERVDELGSASVPFKFDVHSFIFSNDAVSLETELHRRLNDKRVNKVNLRKEFFHATVDELESLVAEIDPTAEFNKTMAAEEYRQSISGEICATYSSDDFPFETDDDLIEA